MSLTVREKEFAPNSQGVNTRFHVSIAYANPDSTPVANTEWILVFQSFSANEQPKQLALGLDKIPELKELANDNEVHPDRRAIFDFALDLLKTAQTVAPTVLDAKKNKFVVYSRMTTAQAVQLELAKMNGVSLEAVQKPARQQLLAL